MLATDIGEEIPFHHQRRNMIAYDGMIGELFATGDGSFGAMKSNSICQVLEPDVSVLLPCPSKYGDIIKIQEPEYRVEHLSRTPILQAQNWSEY